MTHAEDLASKLLQCFPKNRLSAQAALSHEYFSDLPPRLWELTDSEYGPPGWLLAAFPGTQLWMLLLPCSQLQGCPQSHKELWGCRWHKAEWLPCASSACSLCYLCSAASCLWWSLCAAQSYLTCHEAKGPNHHSHSAASAPWKLQQLLPSCSKQEEQANPV